MDKPEEGKQYAITGKIGDKCIANGNTWAESEVKKVDEGVVSVIDIGDTVVCDICNDDYTNSEEKGGMLFSGYAHCPNCMVDGLKQAKKHGEEKFIEARCPKNMTFKDWVMKIRKGNNTIKITSV